MDSMRLQRLSLESQQHFCGEFETRPMFRVFYEDDYLYACIEIPNTSSQSTCITSSRSDINTMINTCILDVLILCPQAWILVTDLVQDSKQFLFPLDQLRT